jgi:hypothetical protein
METWLHTNLPPLFSAVAERIELELDALEERLQLLRGETSSSQASPEPQFADAGPPPGPPIRAGRWV